MSRPTNSTTESRIRNGRKRTGPVHGGTKAKQAARKQARAATKTQHRGSTAPALRVSHDTISRFVPGQKRRRADRIDERHTAGLLGALSAARGELPRIKPAPVRGPRVAPQKAVRDRTSNRASGLRYVYDLGLVNPGTPTVRPARDGEWRDATGSTGEPATLGSGRVRIRRLVRSYVRGMQQIARATESAE